MATISGNPVIIDLIVAHLEHDMGSVFRAMSKEVNPAKPTLSARELFGAEKKVCTRQEKLLQKISFFAPRYLHIVQLKGGENPTERMRIAAFTAQLRRETARIEVEIAPSLLRTKEGLHRTITLITEGEKAAAHYQIFQSLVSYIYICNAALSQILAGNAPLAEKAIQLRAWAEANPQILEDVTTLTHSKPDFPQLLDTMELLPKLETIQCGLTSCSTYFHTAPTSIGSLSHLTTCILRTNNLFALPDSFGDLTQLKTLYLEGNHISTLPDMTKLKKLRIVALCGNAFTDLSHIFDKLPSTIEELHATSMGFTHFPESVKKFNVTLQSLGLAHNQLSFCPKSLYTFQKLSLDLSFNSYEDFELELCDKLNVNLTGNPIHYPTDEF